MMAPPSTHGVALSHSRTETAFEALSREFALFSPGTQVERICLSGASLVTAGSPPEQVSLITAGMVKLWFIRESGEEVISGVRVAPCIVGAECALLDKPSPVTVSALTGCVVRQFCRTNVRRAVQSSPNLAFQMARAIAVENLYQLAEAMKASSGTTRERLFGLLWELGLGLDKAPSDPIPAMHLKKHEIAHLLGVTPEHLSRLLRTMESEGILRRENGRVVLTGIVPQERQKA